MVNSARIATVPLALLIAATLLPVYAESKQREPDCWLTTENGKTIECNRKDLPACMWLDWLLAKDDTPSQDCIFPPCEYVGDYKIQEVSLDGDKATREFVVRVPDEPNLATAEHTEFSVMQVVEGKCSTIFIGNGRGAVLKAKSNGWNKIFHTAATGGPFSYAGVIGWTGKQYETLEEWEDISHEDLGEIWDKLGAVKVELVRPHTGYH